MKMLKHIFVLAASLTAFTTLVSAAETPADFSSQNYFEIFLRTIPDLLSQNSDLFVEMGVSLYISIATIRIAWCGVELATGGTSTSRLVPLLWMIVLVGTLLTFYVQPIPGIGRGFRQLFTDQAREMSQIITNGHAQSLITRLQEFESVKGLAPSSPFDVSGSIRYWLFTMLIAIAQAATIGPISFGFLAGAVAGLVGPFFLPFFLLPGMDWMAWGWLKSFIQYAFYPLIANGYTYVMMQALLAISISTASDMAVLFVPLVVLLITYVYGMLKLTSVVSSIFSGRSGESAFWKP